MSITQLIYNWLKTKRHDFSSRAHRHEMGPLCVMHRNGNMRTIFKITQAVRSLLSEAAWGFEGCEIGTPHLEEEAFIRQKWSPQSLSHRGQRSCVVVHRNNLLFLSFDVQVIEIQPIYRGWLSLAYKQGLWKEMLRSRFLPSRKVEHTVFNHSNL